MITIDEEGDAIHMPDATAHEMKKKARLIRW